MTDLHPELDQAIERVVRHRADRAAPDRLLDDIHRRLDMEPTPRAQGWARPFERYRVLTWLLLLAALLAALAVGATLVGGARPPLVARVTPPPQDVAIVANPSAGPVASGPAAMNLGITVCLQRRPVPFSLTSPQLTGAWTDGNGIDWFRQIGNVLWITGEGRTTGQRAYHGAIKSDGTIHLEWAETGAVTPDEQRTPPWGNGTVDLKIQGSGDSTILTETAETGSKLTSNGYLALRFDPCTPEELAVPSPAH